MKLKIELEKETARLLINALAKHNGGSLAGHLPEEQKVKITKAICELRSEILDAFGRSKLN